MKPAQVTFGVPERVVWKANLHTDGTDPGSGRGSNDVQKEAVDVPGATNASYTTPPILLDDGGKKFRCVVSYPGLPSLTSEGTADVTSSEATVSFDYDYAKGEPAFTNRPLWGPGGWDISMIVDGNRANVVHGDTAPAAGFAYTIDLDTEVDIDTRFYRLRK